MYQKVVPFTITLGPFAQEESFFIVPIIIGESIPAFWRVCTARTGTNFSYRKAFWGN